MTISIILPTFNRSRYLPLALDSILAQTYRDLEVIVVDDGSTDDTEQVVMPYSGQIKYIYQENQGRGAARNVGLQYATGEYIAFLDSDDLWHPDKLERQVPVLEANADSAFVHGPVDVIDENGCKDEKGTKNILRLFKKAGRSGFSYENLIDSCLIFMSAILVKKECFRTVGVFDRSLRILEDLDWYLRVARRYRIAYLDGSPLVSYRFHKGNAYRVGDQEVLETYERIFTRHLQHPGSSIRGAVVRSRAHLSLSFCYAGLGQPKLVRYHIIKAIALNPRSVLSLRSMARLFKSLLKRS
jgi:glycosyltransferase involved in cell wall biosynthesis